MQTSFRLLQYASLMASSLLLAGCISTPTPSAHLDITQALSKHTNTALHSSTPPSEETLERLKNPLTSDDAVQIALWNHPVANIARETLGIAAAEFIENTQLSNPSLSIGFAKQDSSIERSWGLGVNLAEYLLKPLRTQLANKELERARYQTTLELVQHIYTVRQSYYEALAAQESLVYRQRIHELTSIAAEFSQRMQKMGRLSRLDMARKETLLAQSTLKLKEAERLQKSTHDSLAKNIGINPSLNYTLPEHLPDLPNFPTPSSVISIEQAALNRRLDIQIQRLRLEAFTNVHNITQQQRWMNLFDVDLERTTFSNEPIKYSTKLKLEIPLFHTGEARTQIAEGTYKKNVLILQQVTHDALFQIQQSYQQQQAAFQKANYLRHTLIPLHKIQLDEIQLRYNGMLVSLFELLAESQQHIQSVEDSVTAQKEAWLALIQLQQALIAPISINQTATSTPETTQSSNNTAH